MKNNKIIIVVLFLCLISSFTQAQNTKKGIDRPKLVVGIIVDQMRWDYMYRLYDRYGDTGFRRLLDHGFSYENCMINYLPSFTAVGHSSVYTGSVPTLHAITGNSFIEQSTGRKIYCTEDATVQTVGLNDPENKVGKMSPYNLKVTTITDQLKYATNFRSKVVGVSLKDRGSILPAGHAADAAYWFDTKSGNWITSTFYMEHLPKWLSDYNALKMPEKYLKRDWNPTYPIETYTESPDISTLGKYEMGFDGYEILSFPMKTSEMIKTLGVELIQNTPYGDNITTDVAKLVVENEKLGHNQYGETDFLAISYSSPDKMGHQYSINTILTEDAYIKLDMQIGEMLAFLDEKIGRGEYLVFLTADHAGTPNAKFVNEHKIPGGVWSSKAELPNLNNHLQNIYGADNLVLDLRNYQVNFNYKKIKDAKIDIETLKHSCINYLESIEGVMYAIDAKRASDASIPLFMKEKIINGYHKDLSGEIQIILKPGWYEYNNEKGGTHGTWGPDDIHIPFVLFGWNITKGSTSEEVYVTDIAPTLVALLHIQTPNGSIGKSVVSKMHK